MTESGYLGKCTNDFGYESLIVESFFFDPLLHRLFITFEAGR